MSEITSKTRRHIIERSLTGVKWTFLLSPLGTLTGYATVVLLARLGPEMLGIYSIFLIATTLAATFIMFGGSNVIINFIPKLNSNSKSGFLVAYAIVCASFALIMIAILLCFLHYFSDAAKMILGNYNRSELIGYAAFLFPAVLLQTFMASLLSAHMLIKETSMVNTIVPLTITLSIGLAYFTPKIFKAEPYMWIAITIVIAQLISFVTGVLIFLRRKERFWQRPRHLFLPPGFWRFSIPFHINTLLNFFLGQAEQIIAYKMMGVEALGLYRAAFATANFVIWFPDRLIASIYPGFCHMVAHGDRDLLQKSYNKALVAASVLNTVLGLFLICFAHEIFHLFGRLFLEESLTTFVILTAGFSMLFPIFIANGALIVASGRNDYYMACIAIGVICIIICSLLLVGQYGIVGLAWARVIAFAMVVFTSCLLVRYVLNLAIQWATLVISALPIVAAFVLKLNFISGSLTERMSFFAIMLIIMGIYIKTTEMIHYNEIMAFIRPGKK